MALRAAFDAPTPWRTLEAGIRMERSWPVAWEALRDGAMGAGVRERIERSFREHGRALAMIPTRLWPRADHNHFLTEMAGLLRLALLFPEWSEPAAWDEAVAEIRWLARVDELEAWPWCELPARVHVQPELGQGMLRSG